MGHRGLSEQPLLQVRGVSKTFPGLKALDGVSTSVSSGEIVALVGQNGSGKSTLVKILAGVHHPDPGSEILLAEDDDNVREFVARALEHAGHAVTRAEDGGIAAELAAEAEGAFDLLLSDIKMPVMDGIALALQVGASYPQMIIVLMTGFADQRERAHGLEALIYDVIAKPFSLADLVAKVTDALAGKPVEIVSLARLAASA